MMNTRFKEKDPQKVQDMTVLYSQIFAVLLKTGKPIIQTALYLNEVFEDIYEISSIEKEVYEFIFDELNIKYSEI